MYMNMYTCMYIISLQTPPITCDYTVLHTVGVAVWEWQCGSGSVGVAVWEWQCGSGSVGVAV